MDVANKSKAAPTDAPTNASFGHNEDDFGCADEDDEFEKEKEDEIKSDHNADTPTVFGKAVYKIRLKSFLEISLLMTLSRCMRMLSLT